MTPEQINHKAEELVWSLSVCLTAGDADKAMKVANEILVEVAKQAVEQERNECIGEIFAAANEAKRFGDLQAEEHLRDLAEVIRQRGSK